MGILERYVQRTPGSLELWRGFSEVLVDGNTRSIVYHSPHPVVVVSGSGASLIDADGNRYLDLLNNYTLVHGNAHPALIEAAISVMATGTVFPSPHELQARHAAMLVERIAGAEAVRYTNSGTEAAMLAVRIARAATGRDVVAKARFGYHGGYDGLAPNAEDRGEPGVPRSVAVAMRLFEFNEADDLEWMCRTAGGDLAAIVLEPVLGSGGAIPAAASFMAAARRVADELGALLILDEVQTFRLDPGGMQSVLGVHADLTVLGKLIGGGFPIGAVAGARALLDVLAHESPRRFKHAGTFNGNLVLVHRRGIRLARFPASRPDQAR